MSKLTWDEVIKRALYDYVHRDEIAYLYGTDGQIGSDELVDRQVATYPSHFAGRDIQAIKAHVRGKRCYDCSGWIRILFDAPDMSSSGIIGDCSFTTSDLVAGVAGSVLWKPGHIGLDVGYGYCLDIPTELNTIRLQKISEYNWTTSGQWEKYCDYEGANNR